MAGILQGKIALVTGAGMGLGQAAALAFAREGAKVVVADIDAKNGQKTVDMIKKAGGEAIFIKTDVSKEADVENMVNKTVATYGRLDCAHNNVGIEELPQPLTDGTEAQWYRLVDVDMKGVWLCLKHEIKYMEKHGGGSIVNTSSIAGLIGAPGQAIYCCLQVGRQRNDQVGGGGLRQGGYPREFRLSRRNEGDRVSITVCWRRNPVWPKRSLEWCRWGGTRTRPRLPRR